MILTINYIDKAKEKQTVNYETTKEDILEFFKIVKNLEVKIEYLKYLDLNKIESQEEFINWANEVFSKRVQKEYDDTYAANLIKAKEQIEENYKEDNIDEIINKAIIDNNLLSCSKNSLKKWIIKQKQ